MKRVLLAVMVLFATPLWAEEAKPVGDDPVIEQRMNNMAKDLRCLVCQNETLAASHAELAEDLRKDIRQQMRLGKSDKQVIKYLTDRYGDFVLYNPPMRSYTILLWFGPFAFLLLGATVWYFTLKKRRGIKPFGEVSADARKQAADLLKNND
jgi:cytochrome c-type biogenesis protein CcmH